MRRLVFTALMALVLAGCARRPSAPVPVMQAAGVPQAGTAETVEFGPPPGEPAYQGKTAVQWSQQLQSPAQMTRHQAAAALGQLDEAGFPYLLQGMRSGSSEVRRSCLQAVYKGVLVKHERETFDLLVGFLKDKDPGLREAAVTRLGWLEKRGGPAMPQIRRLAMTETDPQVRFVAEKTLYQLSVSMSSATPSHDEFNAKFGQNR